MSDTPQGAGWWQASDAKWYPPEAHPGAWARQPDGPPGYSPYSVGQPGIPVAPAVGDRARPNPPFQWVAVVVGAVAVALGSVLPWATIHLGNYGEFAVKGTDGDGVFTLAIAFVLVAVGVAGYLDRQRLAMAIAALVGSVGVLIVGVVDLTHISRITSGDTFGGADDPFGVARFLDVSTGFGLYLLMVGAVVSVVGAAVWLVRR